MEVGDWTVYELRLERETGRIVDFLRTTVDRYGFRGVVLGVSGGVDSAVVLALLVRAFPKERILALILPERDSSRRSVRDAKLVCRHFGIRPRKMNVSKIVAGIGAYALFPPAWLFPRKLVESYSLGKWQQYDDAYLMDLRNEGDELFLRGVAYYRSKHRARMCKLYFEAERRGYCVVGTTNRTELLMGLYVKWGDDAVDIEPLLHLYKTEVFELAKHLGVPAPIVEKPPTPDLVPGLTDEMAFGLSYWEIDEVLKDFDEGNERDDPVAARVRKILENTKLRELRSLHLERF